MEIWREIANSKDYSISNLGNVKRLERKVWSKVNNSYSKFKEKLLVPNNNNVKGYYRIRIYYKNQEISTESVHRLVGEAFIPNPDNLPQINHKDGNKGNNNVNNLEWCTQSYNMKHRREVLGIKPEKKGEDCNFSVLEELQVKRIPGLLLYHSASYIAKLFKVAPTTITEITSGRSWAHLNLTFKSRKTSKYKGVFYRKDKVKWGYTFKHLGKVVQSCKFNNENEAYLALLNKKKNLE